MNLLSFKPISFKGDFVYKDRYIPSKQDITHDVIRAHFEHQCGDYFYYSDQLEKEKNEIRNNTFKKAAAKKLEPKNDLKVDSRALKNLKISAFSERRKNELYSGAELSCEVDKLKKMKEAGIKSVLCLAPVYGYEESTKEAELNYKPLSGLGNHSLNIFDVNGDMVKDLIRNPENWVKGTDKTASLKTFIETLNGENPELPLPLYFGCHNGTDRTFMWYELYNILKDQPQDEPLSIETTEKLAEFSQHVDEYFRW